MEPSGPLLTSLLREVSRSFYLTVRVLPGSIRSQIGVAYLLARATDTIADTTAVPIDQRLAALGRLRARILGDHRVALDFDAFVTEPGAVPLGVPEGGGHPLAAHPVAAAERRLLDRLPETLDLLAGLDSADQQLIRTVLSTITSGQELDLQRFGQPSAASAGSSSTGSVPTRVRALATESELDDYTYRVAGCVGEFWTQMCRRHLLPRANLDDGLLLTNGVRFGKGLQLVNILRDLPRDLRANRCYLPGDRLAAHGLTPDSLLDPASMPRLRPVYDDYLRLAEAYLADGWNYTNQWPRAQVRLRLACAWPLLIGARTLARLRRPNVLEGTAPIKIGRAEVRDLIFRSVAAYPFPGAWNRLFARAGQD